MKKFFFAFILLTGSLLAVAQTKTTKDLLLDTLCKCITAKKEEIKNASTNDIQKLVMGCFMSDGLELMMKYAEEKKIDFSNQEAMQKMGNGLGMELAKNCPAMMQIAMNSAIAEDSNGANKAIKFKDEEVSQVEGTIVSLNTTEYPASIQLKQKSGVVKKSLPGLRILY